MITHTAKTMTEDRQSRIDALFRSYRESLPPLLAELESSWSQLEKHWDADLAAEFYRKVHGLAGSAATFKLAEIGDVAREIENSFRPLLDAESDRSKARWSESRQLLLQLKEMIESSSN